MRWWKELRTPRLKCERIGHKTHVAVRRGYRKSRDTFSCYVAESVTQHRICCKRCGETIRDWQDKNVTSLTGLRMSEDAWDVLNDQGVLWNDYSYQNAPYTFRDEERNLP
jgi:hypothetical protein